VTESKFYTEYTVVLGTMEKNLVTEWPGTWDLCMPILVH
jgi:hypothetical protein